MIRVIICDDEKHLRYSLRKIVEKEFQLKGLSYKINEYECGEALIADLTHVGADIIFLDIEMKALDGIATAKIIRKQNEHGVIIFVTAFPDFVFHGYEVRALNYILKPYETQKIVSVLETALDDLKKNEPFYYTVEQKSGSSRLLLDDTYYFMSDRRKIKAVTEQDSLMFYGKLNDLELEVPDFFIRIHNRYLVNLNHISSLENDFVVCGPEKLPVSRQYKHELAVAFAQKMLR